MDIKINISNNSNSIQRKINNKETNMEEKEKID